jgi:hypothetical protein
MTRFRHAQQARRLRSQNAPLSLVYTTTGPLHTTTGSAQPLKWHVMYLSAPVPTLTADHRSDAPSASDAHNRLLAAALLRLVTSRRGQRAVGVLGGDALGRKRLFAFDERVADGGEVLACRGARQVAQSVSRPPS